MADREFFRLVRHPLRVRLAEVVEVAELTPGMRRITLAGPELEGFTSLAPEDHIKVFFPAEGESTPVVPSIGPSGLIPPVSGKPIARDYTVRRFDAAQRRLDIDFFLHGDAGVAARWAAQAAPRQQLAIGGPRGSFVLTEHFKWQLFIGDETALPEVGRRIEELPAETRAIALLAVNGPREEQPLLRQGPVDVTWLHRPTPSASLSDAYRAALASLPLPEGSGFIWIAGEALEVRAAYAELVKTRGVDKARVHASGHWKRGVANHDHHEPIDA